MTTTHLRSRSSHREDRGDQGDKFHVELLESANIGQTTTSAVLDGSRLPKNHRDYLIKRHGTLELDPMPGTGPSDPLNWPEWKVFHVYPTVSLRI